jgi:hypothetical protein
MWITEDQRHHVEPEPRGDMQRLLDDLTEANQRVQYLESRFFELGIPI